MSVLVVLQARMGSRRLPGKMLMPIVDGRGALALMVERIRACAAVDDLVVATTVAPEDDALQKECSRLGVKCYRGSIEDVLDRMARAADLYPQAETIVRLTGDCPLHDPAVIARVIEAHLEGGADYTSNVAPPTFPDGLDVEVISRAALMAASREASLPPEREHVTPFIRNRPQRFPARNVRCEEDHSAMRWTLDEVEDLEMIRRVYAELASHGTLFGMRAVLDLLACQPEITASNANIPRNSGAATPETEDATRMSLPNSNSRALQERALRVTPVAAQTFSKSYRYYSGDTAPYFLARGKAGHVWDVDGREYIDFVLGLGPVTVGYANEEVNEAVRKQLERGISFSQSTELEVRLAEKLVELIPCAEMVRFVKNGSDATTAAVRLARASTGRDKVIVCGYHGMHDWYVSTTAMNKGVPAAVRALTLTVPFNDLPALEALLAAHHGEVAAVVLEPAQGSGPAAGYLQALRALTEREGVVLVFDEVISGFRIAMGGAQEYYGVTPDLAAVGKGMANGLPVSAVVGSESLLRQIEDGVFISTTFGGEALSLAGALMTIEILERPYAFEHIWTISTTWFEQACKAVTTLDLDAVMKPFGLPPHSGFQFTDHGTLKDLDLLSVFQQRLLEEGILTVGINNFCLEHTPEDVATHLDAFGKAIDDVRRAVEANSTEGILKGDGMRPVFPRN